MTDDQVEPIDVKGMTPKAYAARFGGSIESARNALIIARGEWCGDVLLVEDDGTIRPDDHGENWNPPKGYLRTHPWPDGTFGRKRRKKGTGAP